MKRGGCEIAPIKRFVHVARNVEKVIRNRLHRSHEFDYFYNDFINTEESVRLEAVWIAYQSVYSKCSRRIRALDVYVQQWLYNLFHVLNGKRWDGTFLSLETQLISCNWNTSFQLLTIKFPYSVRHWNSRTQQIIHRTREMLLPVCVSLARSLSCLVRSLSIPFATDASFFSFSSVKSFFFVSFYLIFIAFYLLEII